MYQKLYEAYKNLSWCDGLMVNITVPMHLERKFGDRMRLELDALHRQLFPRRKKIDHRNLPEEATTSIQGAWADSALIYLKCAIGRRSWLKRKLFALAQTVEIVPGEHRLMHQVSSGAYGSQGYDASRYARQSAERYADSIRAEGFTAEVKEANDHTDGRWGIHHADYEVWGNLEDWQVDALQRRSKTSLLDWAVSCWRNGVNPKVYDPFLPYDIFDKSCSIWSLEIVPAMSGGKEG